MAVSWTKAQSDAITTRDRTLLVSAAAGSGKTAALTERILSSLLDPVHPADLSRILVVTFTEASAADVRAKIASALRQESAAHPENHRLSEALLLVPSASFCTIDSLCNKLVRRHAEEAGVSPSYRIADPTEGELLAAALMEELIEDCYAGKVPKVGSAAAFAAFADSLFPPKSENDMGALFLSLFRRLESLPEGIGCLSASGDAWQKASALPFYDTPVGQAVFLHVTRLLSEKAEQFLSALKSYVLPGDIFGPEVLPPKAGPAEDRLPPSLSPKALTALRNRRAFFAEEAGFLSSAAAARTPEELARLLREFSPTSLPSLSSELSEQIPGDSRCKELHATLKKTVSGLSDRFFSCREEELASLGRAHRELNAFLSSFLSVFSERFSEQKKVRGILEFSDLERITLCLLLTPDKNPTPLALSLRKELDAVYIDEFQDVNALQYAIFSALSPEDRLFMVGDVKQSIYSFRHADPRIFSRLRQSYPPLNRSDSGPASLFFSENFRCDRAIVNYVNTVTGSLFRKIGDVVLYTDEDDLCFSKTAEQGNFPVRTLLFQRASANIPEEDNEEEDSKENIAPGEAEWVADEIMRLLNGEKRANGEPIRPGDIALLFRSKPSMRAFEKILSERIPTVSQESSDFFQNPEVLLALSLLNTVDNPRRDVHLAAVLRSPVFGVNLEELIFLRRSFPDVCLFDSLQSAVSAGQFEKGKLFLDMLARWRHQAEGEPVGDLLLSILRDCGLLCLYGDGSEEGHKSLLLLYNYARTFESSSYRGLYNFISYISRVVNSGYTIVPPRPVSGKIDAVRLMTIHASKGLEFPVCFLCDVGHSFNRKDASLPLLFSDEYGLSMRFSQGDGSARAENPVYSLLAEKALEKAAEEELRILYVALTRARERLYVTGSHRNPEKLMETSAFGLENFGRKELLSATGWLPWITAALRGDRSAITLVQSSGEDYRLPAKTENACAPFARRGSEDFSAPQANPPQENMPGNMPENTPQENMPEEERLRRLFLSRFSFRYPAEALVSLPEKLSVSRLFPALLDRTEEETPLFPGKDNAEGPGGIFRAPEKRSGESSGNMSGATDESFHPLKELHGQKDGNLSLITPYVPSFISPRAEDEAALRGTATHLFLQFCDFENLAAAGPAAELERLRAKAFLSEEEAARVRLDEISLFCRSALFARMQKAARVRRELRFHVFLPAAAFTTDEERRAALAGEKILVQGVIDCILEETGGAPVLVDYKTDRLTGEMLRDRAAACAFLSARHREQLSYYAAAVEQMYGTPPGETLLYSLPLGDTVTPDLLSLS